MIGLEEITSVLTDNEKTLLKDTIIHGEWGSCDYEFLDGEGNEISVPAIGFCTNDAKRGGHFSGRTVSNMFRSIYRKLCPACKNNIGQYLSHCHDWWDDGAGDMLFIRESMYEGWTSWANVPNKTFQNR